LKGVTEMTVGYTKEYNEAIGDILEQLERLILDMIVVTLKELNYKNQLLKSVPPTSKEDNMPF
jgi:hypothetical protein